MLTPKAAVKEALGKKATPIKTLSLNVYLLPGTTAITVSNLTNSPAKTMMILYSTTSKDMSLKRS